MNDMGLFVLGARTGNGPGPGALIELVPFERGDLFPPLAGKRQEFHDSSVWRWHSPGCENNGREFLVGQDAIPTDFPIG